MSIKRLVPLNTVNLAEDPQTARLGDIYYNTVLNNIKVYTNTGWVAAGGGGGAAVHIQTTAPTSAVEGDLWFNNVDPHFYTFDGTYWVEVSLGPVGPAGPGLPEGGTAGQIPSKNSSTDFDVSWINPYTSTTFASDLLATGLSSSVTNLNTNLSNLTTTVETKAPIASPTFTGNVVLPSTTTIGNISGTEIAQLDGITNNIQEQLNNKADITTLQNTVADYLLISDRGNPDGVASLDSTGHIPDSEIPSGIARDSEVSISVSNALSTANSYTDTQISALINAAPNTLDTLKEISDALSGDASFATNVYNKINDLEMNILMGAI